jgi:putative salt-induced outer membrane protein YdiY
MGTVNRRNKDARGFRTAVRPRPAADTFGAMLRCTATEFRTLLVALALTTLTAFPRALAAQKADTLILDNGDRIIGDVKSLENGLLQYGTDDMGTVDVRWDHVARLTSPRYFEVQDAEGRRYFGSLEATDSAGYLAVRQDSLMLLQMDKVVGIVSIKRSSWLDRIDGYFDLGFSYAKSNQTVQLTSALDARYLIENWSVLLSGDLFLQSQNGAKPTRRWSIQPGVQRQLAKQWLVYGVAQAQKNEELGLILRALVSPGVGRYLVRTNSQQASALVGLALQRERYRDSTQTSGEQNATTIEGSLTGSYHAFRYDSPELDFSANLHLYPSLSDPGRVRSEGDLRIRYEIVKDFFVTLAFLSSTDSRPPNPGTPKSDFTTTLSLTYKF